MAMNRRIAIALTIVLFVAPICSSADESHQVVRIGSNRWEVGGRVSGLALSFSGQRAAISSHHAAMVVNLPDGDLCLQLPVSRDSIRVFHFLKNDRFLFDGGARKSQMTLWDISTGRIKRAICLHPRLRANATEMAISPDEQILAVAYDYYPAVSTVARGAAIFDVASGKPLWRSDQWPTSSEGGFSLAGDRYRIVAAKGEFSVQVSAAKLDHRHRDRGFQANAQGGGRLQYRLGVRRHGNASTAIMKAGKGNRESRNAETIVQSGVSGNGKLSINGGSHGTVHVGNVESGKRADPPRPDLWRVNA